MDAGAYSLSGRFVLDMLMLVTMAFAGLRMFEVSG
tara:strand:+ start:1403 stop:1507 length:105 start_codon:yes stop_codon:yes gene_type:complete